MGIESRNKQKPPTRQEKAGEKMQPGGYRIKKRRKKQWILRKFLQRLTTQY